MERGSRLILFLALFAGLYFLFNGKGGDGDERQKIQDPKLVLPEGERPQVQTCDVWTEDYRAQISTRGGVIVSQKALSAKYRKGGVPRELVTAPDHPRYSPLFTSFRSDADLDRKKNWLVDTDVQDFTIEESTGKTCRLSYRDKDVRITKTFSAGETPYTIHLETEIENVGTTSKSYSFSANTASFLRNEVTKSAMFRMNPMMTHVECITTGGEVTRENVDAFAPSDFQEDTERFTKNSINSGWWSQPAGQAHIAAVSNAYFTDSIEHEDGPSVPSCLLQVDEVWGEYKNKEDDPDYGAIYRSRLAYEPRDLAPGEKESFKLNAFLGPKERKALAAAGEDFSTLIDLGFFSIIAKVLVGYLLWLYEIIPSWGVAIVLLTVTARMLLFPLTWPSIKNMIHMRELKPEMEKLNEKYKDDAQAKGLAQMQLWKKHGVNPMKGCLPQLISMPVWFALYTTLQTAVELYNIPFLWFPDLSEADPYYILPFVIGAVFFVQQKLMPMQADPAQQKMMMYFMPGMFTVFMLFLPAGLGVYMFTNSLLGILQQQVVERHAKATVEERRNRVEVIDTPGAEKKKKKKRS